jgi:hypothetical protein
VTTTSAGGMGKVDAKREGRAVPEPSSMTRSQMRRRVGGSRRKGRRRTGTSGEVDQTSFDTLGEEQGRREEMIRQ